jgi:hypothetical protein
MLSFLLQVENSYPICFGDVNIYFGSFSKFPKADKLLNRNFGYRDNANRVGCLDNLVSFLDCPFFVYGFLKLSIKKQDSVFGNFIYFSLGRIISI